MSLAYPLQWPPNWPRTKNRQRSRFSATLGRARDGAVHELELLGATDIVVSTNIPLRRDGLPRALPHTIDDPGVAVYFTLQGESRCVPVDKWYTVAENMQAVGKTIEALRGIGRWGAEQMVPAAFAGFASLPAGATTGEAWWEILGVPYDAWMSEIEEAYRRLAKQTHPDMGVTGDDFIRITRAYRQAKQERKS